MNPADEVRQITAFVQKVFTTTQKSKSVIAVSGGIDSTLSLTLLTKALGPDQVYPLFLPYGDQSIEDSKLICTWNQVPKENWQTFNIMPIVNIITDALCHSRGGSAARLHRESGISDEDSGSPISRSFHDLVSRMTDLRRGNIMARVRMICVFDTAKKLDALVCGTENKSEHYLGYFTRFGDSASDIEPISHLYKTQVRELVKFLKIPKVFLAKPPSDSLWEGQTDEQELGFSYEEADPAIEKYLRREIAQTDIEKRVFALITAQEFKHQVPYCISSQS